VISRLIVCFAFAAVAVNPAYAQDRSTPEATVRSFAAAIDASDAKRAATCVKGVRFDAKGLDDLAGLMKRQPLSLTVVEVKSTQNGSQTTATAKLAVKSNGRSENVISSVNLTHEGANWLIVADAAKARQAPKDPDLLNLFAYMLTAPSLLTDSRDSARSAVCLSNVKQLCLGAIMLSQDYDGVFKLSQASMKKSLMPYLKNAAVFTCPSAGGADVSYSFNSSLAGKKVEKLSSPSTTVLFYEGKDGKLTYRHKGNACVGFADGHVKMLSANAARSVRWKP
jgi:prepilin-type processing-associated H-X9-DG protein